MKGGGRPSGAFGGSIPDGQAGLGQQMSRVLGAASEGGIHAPQR